MGKLIDGVWSDQWYDTKANNGKFIRENSSFRNWITTDGEPGITGVGGFLAEIGRYHLYISHACPWAHRALILRELKGLTNLISVDVVHPIMLENGWTFGDNFDGANGDSVLNTNFLYQIYLNSVPDFTGRVTVPVLFDKVTRKIVSNESSEIIQMFNSAFDRITKNNLDLYPAGLREEIDTINEFVYHSINNGVYKTGFSTNQDVYDSEVTALFDALEKLERVLDDKNYLCGNNVTLADIRLFTTLIRFDPVYVGHFKCNLKRIQDFPNLWRYTQRIYNYKNISDTVRFDHITTHYYTSHKNINPSGIVPLGPKIDYTFSN